MALYCRNPSCPNSKKALDGFPEYCPHCALPVMGSVLESEALPPSRAISEDDPAPAPRPVRPEARIEPERKKAPRPVSRPRRLEAREAAPPEPAPAPATPGIPGLFNRLLRTLGTDASPPVRRPENASLPSTPPIATGGPRHDPGATVREGRSKRPGYAPYLIYKEDDKGSEPWAIAAGPHGIRLRIKPVGPANEAARAAAIDVRNTRDGLEITPRDAINGVFLAVEGPVKLASGDRIRIGDYLIEFRQVADEPIPPLIRDGERLWAKNYAPTDRLTFIRPDGSDGLSIPLVRVLLFGRGEAGETTVDVPLSDKNISRRHTQIAPTRGGAIVEDLKSANGTFYQIHEPTLIVAGAILRLGGARLRVTRQED